MKQKLQPKKLVSMVQFKTKLIWQLTEDVQDHVQSFVVTQLEFGFFFLHFRLKEVPLLRRHMVNEQYTLVHIIIAEGHSYG